MSKSFCFLLEFHWTLEHCWWVNPSCDGLSLTRVDGEKFCGSGGQELRAELRRRGGPSGGGRLLLLLQG